jgi:isopentenyl-diphosphate delta-isomerase
MPIADATASPAEFVVLVDEQDREVGTEEKLSAHRRGVMHRAFSVFVFDERGRLMLQRRAPGKYHSAGLWANTCCGHPRPGEPVAHAARRRLNEEMGFDCPLEHVFSFVYRAPLDAGLTEHELDHVFVGRFDGSPLPDRAEVSEWRASSVAEVADDLARNPGRYAAWFQEAFEGIRQRRAVP